MGRQGLHGGVISADDEALWENARQLWSRFAAAKVQRIHELAGTDRPAVLIALAKHPDKALKNIVVGVFELVSVWQSESVKGGGDRRDGSTVAEYPGWEFGRAGADVERPSTREHRDLLLYNTLVVNVHPVARSEDRRYLQGFD